MNPLDPELARMVITMFGLDPRVAPLLERCTHVLDNLDTSDALSDLKPLIDDVQSIPLVIDIGVAYLLNAVSRMHTHPDDWANIWRLTRNTPVGSSLPSPGMRKRMSTERSHQLRLLEDAFPTVKYAGSFPQVADAIREVVCSMAIRIPDPDALGRAWKATIACYLITYDVATAAKQLNIGDPELVAGGFVDFLRQHLRVGEHDLV